MTSVAPYISSRWAGGATANQLSRRQAIRANLGQGSEVRYRCDGAGCLRDAHASNMDAGLTEWQDRAVLPGRAVQASDLRHRRVRE